MLLAETASNASGSMLITLVPLLLIVAMFFFISRQRKKQMAAHSAMLTELSPGTAVVLNSGIRGTVRAVLDEDLEVEIAPGVVITVLTQAVGRVERPSESRPGDDLISDARPDRSDDDPPSPIKEN